MREVANILLVVNFLAACIFFVRKKNEVPFFLAIFNFMVEYRIYSLQSGYGHWVHYDYGIDFNYNMDVAYLISNYIILGTTIMMYSYMFFYKPNKKKVADNDDYFRTFLLTQKTSIFVGVIFFGLLTAALSSGSGGYALLTKLGTTSFVILFFLLMSFTKGKKFFTKVLYFSIFISLCYITWGASLRFQFLGWLIPVGVYLVRKVKPAKKIFLAVAGISLMLMLFSLAGVLRYHSISNTPAEVLVEESYIRLMAAEDVNFIDGFIMIYRVFPDYLDYSYGLEHIQIFLRPIPRSLWPGKPLASWVRNYEYKYNHGEVLESAGFSPTIWGVFYQEAGVIGVVIFSLLWGWLLAYFYKTLSNYRSSLSYISVGILLASLVPIFRSGDMAGDFAIVLMSYWPMIVFVKRYNKFLKKQKINVQ